MPSLNEKRLQSLLDALHFLRIELANEQAAHKRNPLHPTHRAKELKGMMRRLQREVNTYKQVQTPLPFSIDMTDVPF